MQYSVEAGPCGVTVPNLYAPQCSTPNTTDTPTVIAVLSTVTTSTQNNTLLLHNVCVKSLIIAYIAN